MLPRLLAPQLKSDEATKQGAYRTRIIPVQAVASSPALGRDSWNPVELDNSQALDDLTYE
jgi:hypothetical protein